jgi:cystathionine beta-lyase/cystathionine gamma-synthase
MVPVYLTSTYAQKSPGVYDTYDYSRTANPTRMALEKNLAALEGGKFGYAFSSGMSAIDTTMRLAKGGEHIIVSENTYGGTFRLCHRVLADYGLEFSFVATSDTEQVKAALRPNTRMVGVRRNAD